MSTTARSTGIEACDHAAGVCHGHSDDAVCSVEQLARLGEGRFPANTKTLETRFAARLRGRYEAINRAIRRLVGEEDIFGLAEDSGPRGGGAVAVDAGQEQLAPRAREPSGRSFRFLTESEQHEAFIDWLREAQEAGVVGVVADREGRFLERGYEKGQRNGETLLRRRGGTVPERAGAGVMAGVDVATQGPVDRRVLERIYTRAYHDLQGVTEDTSREVSRALTEAFARGWGPDETATALTDRVDSVGKHQATVLARTELMHAHNESARQLYANAGVERLEILTAAGACDLCEDLAQSTFAIDSVNIVPGRTHPQCRCTVAPMLGENVGYVVEGG